MSKKNSSQKILAKKFKALGHPARIKLLLRLMRSDCCVEEVRKSLDLSQPNVSQHLRLLKDAGIVEGKREKNKICYRITDANILKVLRIYFKGEKGNETHS